MSSAPFDRPFVLLDDARLGGQALLLSAPEDVIVATTQAGVADALDRLQAAKGREAAGFLAYEAGCALEPKLAALAPDRSAEDLPLVWFGLFARCEPVDVATILPDPAGAFCGPAVPTMARGDYEIALGRLHEAILDGDIYQANFTFQAEVATAGHPLALYAALRARGGGGHGGVVFTGTHWLLSFSPELFFTLDAGRATTKPMKGTARRGADPVADAEAVRLLAEDEKQRAENLMIVDLLRNDLSRVSRPGSVAVPSLFAVETYPTVHQLVSTVTARLEPERDAVDVIRALFPCGSVTGAPKIRAMEIIAAQEQGPRGAYCGSIGRIAADGDAAFNVAIRTLTLRDGQDGARLGLGSGIVADSAAAAEWDECLAKGAFVGTRRPFDLIETMRFDPYEGLIDLERHLTRMKTSADALGFAFDRHDARNELQAATFGAQASRVKLLVGRSGALCVMMTPLPETSAEPVGVRLAPLPVAPGDFRLRHKTSDRAFYDEARGDAFEVLFTDPDGFVTEGSFTNVFVERDGVLLTPPLSRGLLPGILRQRLIEEGKAVEANLTADDLQGNFLIGNALRGLMAARLD